MMQILCLKSSPAVSPISRGIPRFNRWLLVALLGGSLLACQKKREQEAPAEGTEEQAAVGAQSEEGKAEEYRRLTAILPSAEQVQAVNNPSQLPEYKGPTGTVRGVVRVTGDSAPLQEALLSTIEANCEPAKSVYGPLFREGAERSLGDVLVAVTGYQGGYVPPMGEAVRVEGEGCAWNARTVVMTYGQRLEVSARDRRAYVPDLMGQASPAQLFVMPGAPPVPFVPQKPGRFLLIDSMRLYNRTDVFVLTYPTAAVTGLDGKFEISGIPVGRVKVNAFLPATNATVEREIEVKENQTVELELSLPFDQKSYEANLLPKSE